MIARALWVCLALVSAAVPALVWWWVRGYEPRRGAHAGPARQLEVSLPCTFPGSLPRGEMVLASPFRRWQEEHAVWLMDIRADVNRVAAELARGGWSDTPWVRA